MTAAKDAPRINDEAGKFIADVSMESLVADWKANAA